MKSLSSTLIVAIVVSLSAPVRLMAQDSAQGLAGSGHNPRPRFAGGAAGGPIHRHRRAGTRQPPGCQHRQGGGDRRGERGGDVFRDPPLDDRLARLELVL